MVDTLFFIGPPDHRVRWGGENMELRIFKCDRCGRKMEMPIDSEPSTITINDRSLRGETKTFHLCDDCMVVLWDFFKYHKEFDELSDKLVEKEYE